LLKRVLIVNKNFYTSFIFDTGSFPLYFFDPKIKIDQKQKLEKNFFVFIYFKIVD